MIRDLSDEKWSAGWLLYATTRNYILEMVFFLYAFIISLSYINYRPDKKENKNAAIYNQSNKNLPLHLKFLWLFYMVSLSSRTAVMITYWTALFEGFDEGPLAIYLQFDRHGIILILLLTEFGLNRIPFRLLHSLYPGLFIFAYLIVNLTYTLVSGEYAYSVTDSNKNRGATLGIFLGLAILTTVLHIVWFFINKLKKL